ncbi:ankyrin repeat-containing protein At2g01680-like [Triticum dicoccoides]|uniref:ankyrin repeat-containing protein At2g01680-like n=1 Tax=Triticum dicoccoides TaxID=85692 RepID=UPI00188E8231|nr:ankyrin repeat-containing protein At2g01680-like [Triticum dicoccoides]
MDLLPLSHQALFAAVRSADAEAVHRLLAIAEESALYIAAEADALEVVHLLLSLYDLEAAKLRSRLDLDAFHVAAKQGHTSEPLFSLD